MKISTDKEGDEEVCLTFVENFRIATFFRVISGIGEMANPKYSKYFKVSSFFFVFLLSSTLFILTYSILQNIKTKNYFEANVEFIYINIFILNVVKTTICYVHRYKFQQIYNISGANFRRAQNSVQGIKDIVKNGVKRGKKVEISWVLLMVFVIITFSIEPISLIIYSNLVDNIPQRILLFDAHLMFFNEYKYTTPFYELLTIYTIVIISFLAFVCMSFESIFVISVILASTQLEIIVYKLSHLFPEREEDYNASIVGKKLKSIIKIHQNTITFVELLVTIYWPFMLISILLYTMEICFSLFQLTSSLSNGPSLIGLFLSPILYLYQLCSYGDDLRSKSELVTIAAYGSGWERFNDSSMRKSIALIITRSQTPLQLGFKFSSITMETFSRSMQTAWSWHAVIKNMGEET